ncbi:MAG: hypothetical protein ACYTG0_45215 [Planctomycetota bacterium]|jgi:hypothetical protein
MPCKARKARKSKVYHRGVYQRGAYRSVAVLLRVTGELGLSSDEAMALAQAYVDELEDGDRPPDSNHIDGAMAAALQRVGASGETPDSGPPNNDAASSLRGECVRCAEARRTIDEILSAFGDIARRIGCARRPEAIREELERLLAKWRQMGFMMGGCCDAT